MARKKKSHTPPCSFTIFSQIIDKIIEKEGGLSTHPNDPGGITKYGISKKQYPSLNIAAITKEDAKKIYFLDYWKPYPYINIISATIRLKIFDLAVHCGHQRAHILTQRALRSLGFKNIVEDGIMGPNTLSCINSRKSRLHLIYALRSETAGFYRSLTVQNPKMDSFIKGWLHRAYDEIN